MLLRLSTALWIRRELPLPLLLLFLRRRAAPPSSVPVPFSLADAAASAFTPNWIFRLGLPHASAICRLLKVHKDIIIKGVVFYSIGTLGWGCSQQGHPFLSFASDHFFCGRFLFPPPSLELWLWPRPPCLFSSPLPPPRDVALPPAGYRSGIWLGGHVLGKKETSTSKRSEF